MNAAGLRNAQVVSAGSTTCTAAETDEEEEEEDLEPEKNNRDDVVVVELIGACTSTSLDDLDTKLDLSDENPVPR